MSKLVIYAMNFAPEFVGVGRYNGEIATLLAASGFDVSIVSTPPHYPDWFVTAPFRNWYASSRSGRLHVLRCPLLIRKRMGGIWRLLAPVTFAITSAPVAAWQILTTRPRIVLCIEPTIAVAPVALIFARLVGARTVLHVQDLEVDAAFAVGHLGGPSWVRRTALACERFLLRRFDRVVTISDAIASRLAARGVANERLSVIRNSIDLSRFRSLPASTEYRRELGIPDDKFVVLYAGSIGAKQALDQLLDAAVLLQERSDILIVVAGEGPAKAGLKARYGSCTNIRFLPFQPEERLNAFLNMADLHALIQGAGAADLVLPSKLGAMLASGKPVLVTAEPGTELATFLADEAVIVPPCDPARLAAAIQGIAGIHPSERRVASASTVAQLSMETAGAAFRDLLLGVAGGEPAIGR